MASIALDDALILSHRANPRRMELSGTTGLRLVPTADRHQPLEQRVLPLIERGRDDPSRAVSIWFGLPVQNPPECVLNR